MVRSIRTLLSRLANCDSGATAIEYALIASLIAVVIIAGVRSIGTSLNTTFTAIGTNLGTR